MRTKKESKTYLNISDKQNETKAYDKTTIAATAIAVRAGAPAKEAVTCEIRKQKRPLTVTPPQRTGWAGPGGKPNKIARQTKDIMFFVVLTFYALKNIYKRRYERN